MDETQKFLDAIIPPDGFPCIALKHKKWKGFRHKVFASKAEMLTKIGDWTSLAAKEGLDMYFCISSLLAPTTKGKGDKERTRVQENCASTQVFVLDIDVGSESPKYPTKQEAAAALRVLNEKLGFPPPTVVNSGGGLHVYWHISHSVESAQWRLMADAFKRILIRLDPRIAADTARVADQAGVLRVPNSFNFKIEGVRKPVQLLRLSESSESFEWYGVRISALLLELGLGALPKKTTAPRVVLDDMPETPPTQLAEVLKKCKWSKAYVQNVAKASEPEWYAMLGLAGYMVHDTVDKGLPMAHMLSKAHPEYSAEETEKKYEQVRLRQTGPTTCSRFAAINPDRCDGCPFMGVITTPIQVNKVDEEAPPPVVVVEEEGGFVEEIAVPAPPAPYYRGENGGIYVRMQDEEGNAKARQIYPYDVFPMRRVRDEETGAEAIELHLSLPKDGNRIIRLPAGLMLDDRRFAVALADRGIITTASNMKMLCGYLISYTQLLQREEAAQEEYARFGWRDLGENNRKFVLAGEAVDHNGEVVRANTVGALKIVADAASAKGNLNLWVKAFSVYETIQGSEPYIMAGMLGFASPLMPLLDQSGLIYNMLGPSGTGKSTSLKIATSIWGKPNSQHAQVHDNRIPVLNTLGSFQNIPMAFDEVTTMEANDLIEIAYAVSQGRGKNRADRSGRTRQNNTTWNTFVLSTSNHSLYDKLASASIGNNAHAYRVFEVRCPVSNKIHQKAINEALATMESNYGMAGRLFIQYVIKNLKTVREALVEAFHQIVERYKMVTAERFWAALLACVYVGGSIAKKLGLHNYNLPKLIVWGANQMEFARDAVQTVEGDAMSVLADFFQSNIRSTLRIVDNRVSLSGNESGVNELKIRVEYLGTEPSAAYVSVPALRKFCISNRIEYSWLSSKLKEEGVITSDNKMRRLGAGTSWTIPPVRCLSLDVGKFAIEKLQEKKDGSQSRKEETRIEA